jgi:GxxExxY protein
MEELNDITFKIRGAIFEVFNVLGPGLLESVYEAALLIELKERGLIVRNQVGLPVKYKDIQLE